jgi:hypothetical protein
VDSGEFGGDLFINRSITVDCAGTAAVMDGIFINNAVGGTVRLRNLTIRGGGHMGVNDTTSRALFIENCTIEGVSAVLFTPAAGTGRLFVTDSVARSGDHGIAVGAIFAPARATIDGVRVEKNGRTGIRAESTGGSFLMIAHVRNSVLAGNPTGLAVVSGPPNGGVASVTVDRSSMTLNGIGAAAGGASAFLIIGRSTVMSNTQGLEATGGAQSLSYQNNHLTGNAMDGAPNAVLSVK